MHVWQFSESQPSLLPPYGIQGLNSGHWACVLALLLAMSSCWTRIKSFRNFLALNSRKQDSNKDNRSCSGLSRVHTGADQQVQASLPQYTVGRSTRAQENHPNLKQRFRSSHSDGSWAFGCCRFPWHLQNMGLLACLFLFFLKHSNYHLVLIHYV